MIARKALTGIDYIIRLPIFYIYRFFEYYSQISKSSRDIIKLILIAFIFIFVLYLFPLILDGQYKKIETFIEYLKKQRPVSSKTQQAGLLYSYQTLITGVLALLAGFFALLTPIFTHFFEKHKSKREIIMRIKAWTITTRSNVSFILNSKDPLKEYTIEHLKHNSVSFLENGGYWSLNDKYAYKADSIKKEASAGIRALQRLEDAEKNNEYSYNNKIHLLELAILHFCFALKDGEHFDEVTSEDHIQILHYLNDPDLRKHIAFNSSDIQRQIREYL